MPKYLMSLTWLGQTTPDKSFYIVMWLFGICMLIQLIISLMMLFKKWTIWANKYGTDPLDHQPRSNGKYRLLVLTLMIVNFLLGSVSGSDEAMERAMFRGMWLDNAQIRDVTNRWSGDGYWKFRKSVRYGSRYIRRW